MLFLIGKVNYTVIERYSGLSIVIVFIVSVLFSIVGAYGFRRSKQKKLNVPSDITDTFPNSTFKHAVNLTYMSDTVLYLRSFEDDWLDQVLVTSNLLDLSTKEENLKKVCRVYGKMVAIGDPKDVHSVLGAERIYLPPQAKEPDWQTVILHWIHESELILLKVGTTDGFLWELSTVLNTANREKVLLLMPKDQDKYKKSAAYIEEMTSLKLPKFVNRLTAISEYQSIIYFSGHNSLHCYYPRWWKTNIIKILDDNAFVLKECLKVSHGKPNPSDEYLFLSITWKVLSYYLLMARYKITLFARSEN